MLDQFFKKMVPTELIIDFLKDPKNWSSIKPMIEEFLKNNKTDLVTDLIKSVFGSNSNTNTKTTEEFAVNMCNNDVVKVLKDENNYCTVVSDKTYIVDKNQLIFIPIEISTLLTSLKDTVHSQSNTISNLEKFQTMCSSQKNTISELQNDNILLKSETEHLQREIETLKNRGFFARLFNK